LGPLVLPGALPSPVAPVSSWTELVASSALELPSLSLLEFPRSEKSRSLPAQLVNTRLTKQKAARRIVRTLEQISTRSRE
jgi:hypothetical protein